MYRGRIKRIHFIGIGGSGMSGIAEVLLNMGYKVSGSDLRLNEAAERLKLLGAIVMNGHSRSNITDADVVVYSSAVKRDNPEIEEASSRQIPIIPRAEMLAELMRMKSGVLVAGTHGKTTTTSLISTVLAEAGLDPTIVIGGKLNNIGSNARLGQGEFMVAEADESDGSFLKLSPTIAVVTNIDREHMDHYEDMDDVKRAYLAFMNKVPFYGCAVICMDHPVLQGLMPSIERRVISYGLTPQADFYATSIERSGMKSTFDVYARGARLGRMELGLPGAHNVYNSLAALAVACELEIPFDAVQRALGGFRGVERRFQIKGTIGDVMVVDDYGHHPVEVKAVLRAARDGWPRRVIVAFQPHRYSRTRDMMTEFLSAFNDAEKLILTDIYAAGEEPIEGISGEALYREIKGHGHKDVTYVPLVRDVAARLKEVARPGDMVITLGAGNIWQASDALLEMLKASA
jgi:UDP-N-acetylmuramate--alanine ligase